MPKQKYPKSWRKKYTDPELRAKLKEKVTAAGKGGKKGQWSARKAQLLKAEYEKAGGGYRGKKDSTQKHLTTWTEEDWQTSDGSGDAGAGSKRYLPKKAWDELSEQEKRATDDRKAKGNKKGRQYVSNTAAAKKAGSRARGTGDEKLPITDYSDLTARDVVKAIGRLTTAGDVKAVRRYERRNAARKTVLDRADRAVARLS